MKTKTKEHTMNDYYSKYARAIEKRDAELMKLDNKKIEIQQKYEKILDSIHDEFIDINPFVNK